MLTPTQQNLIFWAFFLFFSGAIFFLDKHSALLRDSSTAAKKPYSFARVQLAWWTVIILSAFITIMITRHAIPTFDSSTLVLLGISAATTGAARLIDQSDQQNHLIMGQNQPSQGLLLDILSDGTGVNMQRIQTVAFNATFGIYFIVTVLHNLGVDTCKAVEDCKDLVKCVDCTADAAKACYNYIIPKICDNNLILLGLSSGTYAALKATENKSTPTTMPKTVTDESGSTKPPAKG